MTDQTPQTETGRALSGPGGYMVVSDVLLIEAQARAEGLDVEVLTLALHQYRHGVQDGTLPPHCGCFVTAEGVATRYRAILAETKPKPGDNRGDGTGSPLR